MKEVCESSETYLQRDGVVRTQPGQRVEREKDQVPWVHPAQDSLVLAGLCKDILHAGVECRTFKAGTKELRHQASIQSDGLSIAQATHQSIDHKPQAVVELVARVHGVQVSSEPWELDVQFQEHSKQTNGPEDQIIKRQMQLLTFQMVLMIDS